MKWSETSRDNLQDAESFESAVTCKQSDAMGEVNKVLSGITLLVHPTDSIALLLPPQVIL